MSRILCIDDEPGLRHLLRRLLEAEGHTVATAATGIEGLRLGCAEAWDLILLDLVLPDLPGTAVLGALLEHRPIQRVLILSATGDTASRVTCLERGAVDYVGKPFAVRELTARVRSRLADGPRDPSAPILSSSGLQLDVARRRLTWRGETVDLSPREFLLVQHLMRHRDAVCTREELLSEVWGYAFDPGSNVVDVTVARLRAKLDTTVIETVRNVGYCLAS